MESLLQDLKFALRSLRKTPGFTAVIVATLALGIGANTAIFSVVRGILLRPLPYAEPAGLTMLWSHWPNWDKTWLSEPEYADYAAQRQIFDGVAAFDYGFTNLTGNGIPERLRSAEVTANIFPVLGTQPIAGRAFLSEEDRPGGPKVALLGEGLWRRRFGGDRALIGQTIHLNGEAYTVLGVMPQEFRLPLDFSVQDRPEIWTPLALAPPNEMDRGNHGLNAVGRMRPGLSLSQTQTLLNGFVGRMIQDHPGNYDTSFGVTLVPVADEILGVVRPALWVLLGAVGLVLLMACGNVVNLLLARAESRQREIAIRTAIGAGRRRLLRQLLVESVVVAGLGGGVGVLLAYWGVSVLPAIDPSSLPRAESVGIDGLVLLFTLGLSLLAGLASGLLPAWHATRQDLQGSLRETGLGGDVGKGRVLFRRSLVGFQVALAVVLVVGAGLLVRSFARLTKVDPGFETRGVLTMRISPPAASYPTASSTRNFYERLQDRLRGLPSVRSVGAISGLPLATVRGDWGVRVDDRPVGPHGEHASIDWQVATPDYFTSLRIPLLKGRLFTAEDREQSPPVIVINDATARSVWPGVDPIGHRIRLMGSIDTIPRTVIGVVGDVRQRGLAQPVRTEMFLPLQQFPGTAGDSVVIARSMTLTLRVAGRPELAMASLRDAIRALDPDLAVSEVRTMEEVHSRSIATPRLTAVLLGLFALIALVLAAVGIYGVVSFAVSRRTREIGIRMALGARPEQVLWMVLGQGMLPALMGLVAGIGLAVLESRVLRALLYSISATDPLTFATVPLVLLMVASLACLAPARRATRVDPLVALRND